MYTQATGEARWVIVDRDSGLRIILSPDEGGPLYAAYQFLALRGLAIGLNRDELQPGNGIRSATCLCPCQWVLDMGFRV